MIRDVNIRRHNARVTSVNIKQCAYTLLVFQRAVQTNDTANRYADWPDVTMRKRIIPHAHHRVDILIKCTNGNGLRYIHFVTYIRILDRILALNIPSNDRGGIRLDVRFIRLAISRHNHIRR